MLFYCFTHFIYPNYQQRIATVSCSSISSIVVNFQRAKVVHKASKTWNGESQPTHSRLEDATPQQYTGSVGFMYIYAKYTHKIYHIFNKHQAASQNCCTQNWDGFTSFDQKTPQMASNWETLTQPVKTHPNIHMICYNCTSPY